MTVRITKPEFNLREKLTQLDVPLGSHGSQLMKSKSGSESFSLVRAGRKNMIINGGMSINQRNGTSSFTIPHETGGSYGGPDRWAVNEATDGSVSVNMDGDPLGYPQVSEWSKAFQIACAGTASLSSAHNTHFFQNIEGYNIVHLRWGKESAKPVTLSFWVKTNKGGVYSVGLENNDINRCCIRNYYHDGSHTWKKYVLTFPGCRDGTWLTTNGIGMRVRFCLASGATHDDGVDGEWVNSDELHTGNQTNFMSSTNNRFFITGVQLEEGTVATSFEHRPYGEELALCQRYFYMHANGSVDGNGSGGSAISDNASAYNSNTVFFTVDFPVTMRSKPSLAASNGSGHYGYYTPGSSLNGFDTLSLDGVTTRTVGNINFTVSSAFTGGQSILVRTKTSDATLAFNAEL